MDARGCRLWLIGAALLGALACSSAEELPRDEELADCDAGCEGTASESSGGAGTSSASAGGAGPGEPAMTSPDGEADPARSDPPVYRIPLRVHVGRSALSSEALRAVLDEVNTIWLSQAGVCFEIDTVTDNAIGDDGFDLWLTTDPIPDASLRTNGVYRGDHEIWTLDDPNLGASPHPAAHAASRTSAHELGHGLSLSHQDCGSECPCNASLGLDCDDFLMRSGTTGFHLSEGEIDAARRRAAEKALPDTAPRQCAAPAVE